ncbi:MAG: hypothetical protein E3J90_09835 [Promethearchaeota archaeon]|nr:MAG: hypothetical protein E3J90_09835 [Candidatus Lokiarchaeota archaeon]
MSILNSIPVEQNKAICKLKIIFKWRRGFFSEYGEGSGNKGENNSETGSESEIDNKDDSSGDTEEELEGNKEYDFDGKMDFDGMEEYDFDGKMDFDGMESDEENRLEPTGESDISQEPDRDTNADNIDDQSSSAEQENESYENLNSESTSTVLIYENREEEEGVSLQSDDQGHEEIEEINQEELEKEIEKEFEEGVEAINQYLEEEAEFINAYQEMVGETRELDGERESEGEERLKTEEEWEKEVETAAYIAEQLYESTNEIEVLANNEELSEINEELEIEKEVEQSAEVLEPQLSDLQEEFEVGMNEIEQHQVEPLIEEVLEAEPEPVVNEKEIEQLQELDIEEQFNEVHEKEEMEELIEWQDEQIEQEKEEAVEAQTDNSEEIVSELEEEFEVGMNEIEQHQVEPLIEEVLEAEPEPVVNEKEIEQLQELDIEEQFNEVHEKEEMEELIEWQDEQIEQEKEEAVEAQTDNSEEIIYELEEEIDEVEQHQVEAAIEEALETETKSNINEEKLEQLQELELEEQFQMVHFNEYIEELVEQQEEEKTQEHEKMEQEKEKIDQTQEILHQSTYLQEELEEQEQELELEYEEKDEVEQQQVEAAIEEELEIEPKPTIKEEELEYVKTFEPEKQLDAELLYELIEELANKQNEEKEESEGKEEHEEISPEEKVAQIMRELEIVQETKSGEVEVESNRQEKVLEHETTFPDVPEQSKKIEQEVFNKIESEEDSDQTAEEKYERIKRLYKQQTGKRPIYANNETKGFKQWLEQNKISKEKEKKEQKINQKREQIKKQKNEEAWKWFLKNWLENASSQEVNPKLKSELKKLIERYKELEKIIKNFSQLYNKAQREKLSQSEKTELKSLIKALKKLDPIKIELLLSIQEIKHYLDKQYFYEFWDKERVNRVRSSFFKFISQKYENLMNNIKRFSKEGEGMDISLKQRISESIEKEVNSEIKTIIEKLIEDNSEYEKLEKKFMEFYKIYEEGKISIKEKLEFKNIIEKLKKINPITLQLHAEISKFNTFTKKHSDWDSTKINNIQSNYIERLSQKFGKLKDGKHFLKKYAKLTSESYKNEILKAYKKLGINPKQLRIGEEFSFKRSDFEDISKFESIVNSRGKYLWYGLVYEITEILSDKSKGETIAGFTTETMRSRWTKYVFKAVLRQGKGGKLHRLIYNYLNQFGFENLKINEKFNWRLIFGLLNSRFRRRPVEIHFSSNSLRAGEIDYISEHNLTSSGLNVSAGGGGGRSKMNLPMITIAYYIALGDMETEIQRKLKNHGIVCSNTTVRRRINQFWGSFEEAQIKFLRPVFYLFLKNHLKLHEINNVFNRFTLKYIETLFGGKSYQKLKYLVDTENILNLPVIGKLDGWEGITKLRIPASLLNQIILQYAKLNKALKDLRVMDYLEEYERSYYRYTLKRQIHNQLGFPTWDEARKELVLPYIIKEIKSDESFSSIYHKYGWSKSTAHNHNRTSRNLFFGMDSSQVRQFLEDNFEIETYYDFEKEYLAKKG